MQMGRENLSKIEDQIERITFANEENGFTVAKLKTKGEKNWVIVVVRLTILLTKTLAWGQK